MNFRFEWKASATALLKLLIFIGVSSDWYICFSYCIINFLLVVNLDAIENLVFVVNFCNFVVFNKEVFKRFEVYQALKNCCHETSVVGWIKLKTNTWKFARMVEATFYLTTFRFS